jgi:apolipoprotein N-acyltransferase
MTSIALLVAFVMGAFLGYAYRDIKENLKNLKKQLLEKANPPAISMGAYKTPKPTSSPTDARIGLVDAKTPQRMEWEASQKLERQIKLGDSR